MTTVMQVASRLLLVWGIVHNFPAYTVSSVAYSTMLVAWSVTEVIRYSFFAMNLWFEGDVPAGLQWLRYAFMLPKDDITMWLTKLDRYNTFFILYPLGISSECWLIYLAIEPAKRVHPVFEWVLKAILGIYIPGKGTIASSSE